MWPPPHPSAAGVEAVAIHLSPLTVYFNGSHTQLRLWVIVCLFFHCITSEVAFPELEDRLFPAPHLVPLGAVLEDILPQHWASVCSFWVVWPRVVLDLCTSLRQQKYRRNLFYPNPHLLEDPPCPHHRFYLSPVKSHLHQFHQIIETKESTKKLHCFPL